MKQHNKAALINFAGYNIVGAIISTITYILTTRWEFIVIITTLSSSAGIWEGLNVRNDIKRKLEKENTQSK